MEDNAHISPRPEKHIFVESKNKMVDFLRTVEKQEDWKEMAPHLRRRLLRGGLESRNKT